MRITNQTPDSCMHIACCAILAFFLATSRWDYEIHWTSAQNERWCQTENIPNRDRGNYLTWINSPLSCFNFFKVLKYSVRLFIGRLNDNWLLNISDLQEWTKEYMDMKLNLSKQLNTHSEEQETRMDRAKRIARRCILYFVDWVIE